MREIERWCGIECTVNRVGDRFHDQLHRSGHHDRIEDLDRIAALGFGAIRYPVLWERVSPDTPDAADWSWCDERLDHLDRLGLRVIAGLVHHGSGPHYTNLLDDSFAPGLARHAAAVAQRYPWISDWTPVNEPVTTARFAALYGHWYPHARDERSFWRALLNQIDATRLAMRAIRAVNPVARLIQTDDLGRTWATTPLADQAAFDNQRRWMGWDLLCGRVVAGHPLWHRLCAMGFGERLRVIADDPCPPDIIGINHYPTSDRFLDHRVQLYPPDAHGVNARQSFADIPAVRTLDPGPDPFGAALREAWDRYTLPLALTEVHIGCTREEQMRWARVAWEAACEAQADGVDVRAITAWSVLGSHDWDQLVTAEGAYEPGLFDLAGVTPRATGLAQQWQALATAEPAQDVATQPGWWQHAGRLTFDRMPRAAAAAAHRRPVFAASRPLLICGATGTLGQALASACTARGITYRLTDRAACDLLDPSSIDAALDSISPWAVINATGWVRVDDAEDEEEACLAINAAAAVRLAERCAAREIPVTAISSDLVFDGVLGRAYHEDDTPNPLNVYGRSKLAMEQGSLARGYRSLVIRAAAFFSPHDPHNFAHAVAQALARGDCFDAADDQKVSPAYVPALVNAVLDLVIDGAPGIHHLAPADSLSWYDFARKVAVALGRSPDMIRPVPGSHLGWRAPRPANSALTSRHLAPLPEGITDFAAHYLASSAKVDRKLPAGA
ncbi:sugar nucleotide-binding protein [Sphingomonas mucosissima]|uniref:dTDP-4-dehydrorhamnose reductase n=1 Tax=Sphingomonas mucosissima TaxID=370959 RepID=A0A245ZRR8_9SPHN|nr:sugar nucleotide-binding protein [Sphingomonas mucosissima]OWK32439.1 dTDP-4-dehydrorhamnose reductase [Sphingomonas mucosissima]